LPTWLCFNTREHNDVSNLIFSEPPVFKYRAFLSYAHADMQWGKWLHSRLEGYRLDKDLIGRATPIGPVPAALRPIFRDRDDFTGGHSLNDATIAALDGSAALIVLCSTIAATRPAVNEEVRLFRVRHPDRPIIPVIIDGTAPANFPPALRFALAPDGSVTTEPITILGPDLRESGDGRDIGLAKIIAGLTGVGTDEIFRRAERARRRTLRNWIAGLSAVAASLAGLTVWAEINRRDAVEQRSIAEIRRQEAERNFALAKGAADGLVVDIARGLREVEGMRAASVSKILGTARATFEKLADGAPDNQGLQRSRSVMLSEFGETYRTQGNLRSAQESHEASLALKERLSAADPKDASLQNDTIVALIRVGTVLREQGDLTAALDRYRIALSKSQQMLAAAPDDIDAQKNQSAIYGRIGDLLLERGDRAAALENFRASLATDRRMAEAEKGNAFAFRNLAFAHIKIGDVLALQGNLAAAATEFQTSLGIMGDLVKADPANAVWQRNLSLAHGRNGDVLIAQGKAKPALEHYRESLAIEERLVKSDPDNTLWQRDLSGTNIKLGDVLAESHDLAGALERYQAAVLIKPRGCWNSQSLTAGSPTPSTSKATAPPRWSNTGRRWKSRIAWSKPIRAMQICCGQSRSRTSILAGCCRQGAMYPVPWNTTGRATQSVNASSRRTLPTRCGSAIWQRATPPWPARWIARAPPTLCARIWNRPKPSRCASRWHHRTMWHCKKIWPCTRPRSQNLTNRAIALPYPEPSQQRALDRQHAEPMAAINER
jgi:tetratricopeptide (TPR) repeat protein